MKRIAACLLLCLGLSACGATKTAPPTLTPGKTYYLFAYFKDREATEKRDQGVGRGGAGLYLAWSADGLNWQNVSSTHLFKPALSPMMRDPFIARGPDGVFHLVWTTGWRDRHIGYAASDDLISWRDERLLPVMEHEPATLNTWAPEIFYDDATSRFIVFWSSSIPNRFPATQGLTEGGMDHRIYYTATADFQTFTPTQLLYDPGFSCIDADIVQSGDHYVMVLKREDIKPPAKYLVVANADHAEGPWGPASSPITSVGDWSEGPSTIVINGRYYVYFDRYVAGRYALIVSDDLKAWKYSDDLKMPYGVRHGNAFAVDEPTLARLLSR